MIKIRTDLAVEKNELGRCNGNITEENIGGVKITEVIVTESNGENSPGRYITADIGKCVEDDRETFENKAKAVSEKLVSLFPRLPADGGCFLVAGLGNENVSSDSVGPKTVKKLLVTRHIRESDKSVFDKAGFASLASVAPGVMAQTGMESADTVISVARSCGAHCIIAVDALASRRISRLGTSLQLTDTGISPGSGVFNTRRGLTLETADIPVIGIGVPTVVDAATLACDLLEDAGTDIPKDIEDRLLGGYGRTMFIAPKECDVISDKLSRFIADIINLAVHRGLTLDEIREYTS